MFGFLKKQAGDAAKKYSGKTDFLEAVCAAAALIAAADGEIEDSELKATIKAVAANKALAEGFDARTVERTIEAMLKKAEGGRVGKMGLWSEIEDVVKREPTMGEAVLLTALDVAESDGEIEPAEKVVLDRLAKTLGVDLARVMAA